MPSNRGPDGRITAPFALPSVLNDQKDSQRWVLWRWKQKDNGKWDKPPFRVFSPAALASSTDDKTWGKLQSVDSLISEGLADGVGYMLRDDQERIFWDLDDCRDPSTGEISEWAQEMVEAADSYTEITPSGTGLRIIGTHGGFLRAPIHSGYKLPNGGNGEVYFRAPRYVTVSGQHLEGTPETLSDISGPVLDLLAKAGKTSAPAERASAGDIKAAPIRDVVASLACISNADMHYDDWVRVGMAAYAASGGTDEGLEAWANWSRKSQKHQDEECMRVWNSIRRSPPKRISFGTLYYMARIEHPFFVPPSARPEANAETNHAAAGGSAEEASEASSAPQKRPAVWVQDGAWDEAELPKRPWLAPGYLMRGAVSALSGQGSGGKSSLVVCWTIALALGEEVGEFRPKGPSIVINYNVEDDEYEQQRRYSAALRAIGKTSLDIAEKVIRCGPDDIGTLFERDPASGRIVQTPAMQALEDLCMERGADVLVCDPLAELHNADENDNTAMRAVVAAFRGMAKRLGIGILILHHDRKGNNTPGDMDRMRGASAITGAVRVLMTLTSMSSEEAEKFGIAPDQRRQHFRIDGAKSNYALAQEAEWWRLDGNRIGNGEDIAACRPWTPPSTFDGMSMAAIVGILEDMARGQWACDPRAKEAWAGHLLTQEPHGRTASQARSILRIWEEQGVISKSDRERTPTGNYRQNFKVDPAKLSEMRREVR